VGDSFPKITSPPEFRYLLDTAPMFAQSNLCDGYLRLRDTDSSPKVPPIARGWHLVLSHFRRFVSSAFYHNPFQVSVLISAVTLSHTELPPPDPDRILFWQSLAVPRVAPLTLRWFDLLLTPPPPQSLIPALSKLFLPPVPHLCLLQGQGRMSVTTVKDTSFFQDRFPAVKCLLSRQSFLQTANQGLMLCITYHTFSGN